MIGVRYPADVTATPAATPAASATAVPPAPTPTASPVPPATATPAPADAEPTPTAAPVPAATPPPAVAVIPAPSSGAVAPVLATPGPAVPDVAPLPPGAPATPSLLDTTRIVSVYGAPNVPAMGVLGSYSPEDAATEVAALARQYAAPPGALPVIPAFHLVTAVAQPYAGADGDYVAFLRPDMIQEYVDVARAHHMLLFLDVQVGWGDPLSEVRALSPWLSEPFVHIALDPEFATRSKGEAPGQAIGVLTSEQVNAVQAYLAGIAEAQHLPPKILIVHQFLERMLNTPEDFSRYPDVALVIDMDGFGSPALKRSKYDKFAVAPYAEFPGMKLFFLWDSPLMSPADVLALPEPPRIVIYQ